MTITSMIRSPIVQIDNGGVRSPVASTPT
jgi:hypothetical protein